MLTGAGLSTDSGIPDYRGPGAPVRMPMTFQDFVGHAGQPAPLLGSRPPRLVADGHRPSPTTGHRALARLEAAGRVSFLITQNVDGLHERAGQQQMVALHGRISEVVCLDCGGRTHRTTMQRQLSAANPGWLAGARRRRRPGPTVTSISRRRRGSSYPRATGCGGRLKPDVVFFGENVPRQRVERCYAALDEADALLVAGSSLTVMSGLRFVRYAAKAGLPVVIVNRGVTRGDELATVRSRPAAASGLASGRDAVEPLRRLRRA